MIQASTSDRVKIFLFSILSRQTRPFFQWALGVFPSEKAAAVWCWPLTSS